MVNPGVAKDSCPAHDILRLFQVFDVGPLLLTQDHIVVKSRMICPHSELRREKPFHACSSGGINDRLVPHRRLRGEEHYDCILPLEALLQGLGAVVRANDIEGRRELGARVFPRQHGYPKGQIRPGRKVVLDGDPEISTCLAIG